jgi:hypothetical protein
MTAAPLRRNRSSDVDDALSSPVTRLPVADSREIQMHGNKDLMSREYYDVAVVCTRPASHTGHLESQRESPKMTVFPRQT